MAAKGNGRRLIGWEKRERRSVGERLVADERATAASPDPAPGTIFSKEAPPIETYLDPDLAGGRRRIVLMLSEDGKVIEPLLRLGNLSLAQQLSLMVQETALLVEQMIAIAVDGEQTNSQLLAEVEFLREQIRKGAQPPPQGVVPKPFAVVPTEAGD